MIDSNDHEVSSAPAWIALAWRLRASRYEGTSKGLNAAKIVYAAIEVTDREGFSGFSMAKVAQQLGVATMSIYNHIDSKEDLVLVMTDVALGSPPEAIREAAVWQDSLKLWTAATEHRFESHPWLMEAPISGLPSTPNRLLWVEYLLQAMRGSGLTIQEILDCSVLLYAQARYSIQVKLEQQDSLVTQQEAATLSWLAYVDSATFPLFARLIQANEIKNISEPNDNFAIERLIVGIERLQPERGLIT